jgi:hypothetical protein
MTDGNTQWIAIDLGRELAAAGGDNADDASAVIVKAFWDELRRALPKVH